MVLSLWCSQWRAYPIRLLWSQRSLGLVARQGEPVQRYRRISDFAIATADWR